MDTIHLVYLSLVYPIDKGSLVDIMYLDFQKVFDKVPHQRLLLKLKAHGIRDGIIDKMEKWLTDSKQCIIVDGKVSNWKSVLSMTWTTI